MLVTIENILTAEELARINALLRQANWGDGSATAGQQAARVKNNQQVIGESAALHELRNIVLTAMGRSPIFRSAALPLKILPPMFNRYGGETNAYGMHVDSAMHAVPDGGHVRSDVSCTLFLSEPESYVGGELVIEDVAGRRAVKLGAGSIVVYPSSFLHEVMPVTEGERLACFMFIQSMVRNAEQRRMLFDMNMAVTQLRLSGDSPHILTLTGVYHNLLRLWAES